MEINEIEEMTIEDFFQIAKTEGGLFQIETPDGWSDINFLLTKKNKNCFLIRIDGGFEIICADSHLVLTKRNSDVSWVEVCNLAVDTDRVATINGFKKVIAIETVGVRDCFDFNIDSDSSSYYSNGIISHNCGKSLSAKAVAKEFNMPLLRLDFGSLFNSLMGESERTIRHALKMAEAVAPAILWIDEIEKGLVGMNSSGKTDSGVTARVVSTLLTWMQERTSPVFVICTANQHEHIPTEFLRRFDEIFFVDLPSRIERLEIFPALLRRKKRDPKKFDISQLASASDGYTGAEAEKALDNALLEAFSEDKRELTTDDIIDALSKIKPLSKMRPEVIEAMQIWAEERCLRANTADPVPGGNIGGMRTIELSD